jgi:hypothetical protein
MKYLGVIITLATLATGCNKFEMASPNFEVKSYATPHKGGEATTTFKLGDTVVFKFTGNPDGIGFYSGEAGKRFEYRGRVESTIKPSIPSFTFTSVRANSTQASSLALMISTDFNGQYDSDNLLKATWTDITNRAVLSTGSSVASGKVNLADYAAQGKPVYLAFKYTGNKAATAQPKWTITSTVLANVALPDSSSYNVFDMSNFSWFGIDVKNSNAVWSTTSSNIVMDGGPANSDDNIDWAVSRQINLNAVKPDISVSLKNMTTIAEDYTYKYPKAGVFTATLVGVNERVNKLEEVVKQMTITVTP